MKTILIVCLMLGGISSQSQTIQKQVIGSLGGISSGGSYSVDCTVGETVIDTFSSGSFVLYQGYHHANDSSNVSSLKEVILSVNYNLYPNPTANNSKLEITANRATNCSVTLFSAEGRLIQNSLVDLNAGVQSVIELNISTQASGVYFVRITQDNNTPIKTLRLIKQ